MATPSTAITVVEPWSFAFLFPEEIDATTDPVKVGTVEPLAFSAVMANEKPRPATTGDAGAVVRTSWFASTFSVRFDDSELLNWPTTPEYDALIDL